MGGVQIDKYARVVKAAGAPKETAELGGGNPILGLYAGGEVAGGVHGHNRLGGSGLLGAVVFGRKAGFSACRYLFDQLASANAHKRAGALAGQLFQSVNISSSPNGITVQLGFDGSAPSAASVSSESAPASPEAPAAAAVVATLHSTSRLQHSSFASFIFVSCSCCCLAEGKPGPSNDLFKVLTHESAPGVEWLINAFKLDLSILGRLGGHSYPRTHRGKERFPGMTITYALMEKFDDIAAKEPTRAQLISNAKATELITEGDAVVGIKYVKDGKTYTERGPVILATGGFGADFSKDGILAKGKHTSIHSSPNSSSSPTTPRSPFFRSSYLLTFIPFFSFLLLLSCRSLFSPFLFVPVCSSS